MAEKKFTKHFKRHLNQQLNLYFKENELPLKATCEKSKASIYGKNFIDIGVSYHDDDDPQNSNYLVGIEIETISSPKQIELNVTKFRNWVFNSTKRKGGLLHVLDIRANISENAMRRLIIAIQDKVIKDKGFYYEFMVRSHDHRETAISAVDMLDDWEFKTRFLSLVDRVFPEAF
ncbi:hypothetical protein [Geotalea sp. SG265]|uniref:hypothetical protein n=1 Tax=Geotalea sp. SG265 TaxID=2922867 RepID=UPI001FAE86D8|nr:hypothetical protein [Geotalea sp. SG265]